MEKQETGLVGFDPVKFIELLLKLDGRAKTRRRTDLHE